MKARAGLLLAALAFVACDDKSEVTPTAVSKMSDEQVASSDVPVPEDFEEQAAKEITVENVEDEVNKLEAEINGE